MRRGHPAALVAFALGLFALGCDSGNHLALAPVQCLVTLDGKPLGGAKVVFTPEAGRIARGETRDDGLAALSTYGNGDGAIVGKHVVVVFGPNAPGTGRSLQPGPAGRCVNRSARLQQSRHFRSEVRRETRPKESRET